MESLLETFCVADGQILNAQYHAARVAWSTGESSPMARMLDALQAQIAAQGATCGKWRATVEYSLAGVKEVRMIPYKVPNIAWLQLSRIEENIYAKKWADRSRLNAYKSPLATGVEPLFILNGMTADTTFTNVVLEREGRLFTPTTPLLRGTKRAQLLATHTVEAVPVRAEDIQRYQFVHLINAMLDPGDLVIPTGCITI